MVWSRTVIWPQASTSSPFAGDAVYFNLPPEIQKAVKDFLNQYLKYIVIFGLGLIMVGVLAVRLYWCK